MTTIYHNPRCRKSRETLALLESHTNEIEIVKYLDEPLSKETLQNLIKLLGIPAINLVRKGEAIWKEQFKGKDFTEEKLISILLENPKLIERPIVVKGSKAVIGRPPENVHLLFHD